MGKDQSLAYINSHCHLGWAKHTGGLAKNKCKSNLSIPMLSAHLADRETVPKHSPVPKKGPKKARVWRKIKSRLDLNFTSTLNVLLPHPHSAPLAGGESPLGSSGKSSYQSLGDHEICSHMDNPFGIDAKKKKPKKQLSRDYQVVVQGRETNFLRLSKLLKNKTPNNTTNLREKKIRTQICYNVLYKMGSF